MNAAQIAAVCHEVNRQYCIQIDEPDMGPWENLAPEHRAGLIDGVLYLIDTPDATYESMHIRWFNYKAALGWSWGPVKDAAAKLHPSMAPYAKLSKAQKVKDALFKAVVDSLRSEFLK